MLKVATVRHNTNNAGFTLLEVLVALALFSFLSMMLFQAFSSQTQFQSKLSIKQQRWANIIGAWQLIERDLMQVAPRPVRDTMGDVQAALKFMPSSDLEFTSFSWYTGQVFGASQLLRVRYVYDFVGGSLWRESWVHPDRVPSSVSNKFLLLDGVTGFSVRALGATANWVKYWPLNNIPLTHLPNALEVTLSSDDYGEIRRVFTMPEFMPDLEQEL